MKKIIVLSAISFAFVANSIAQQAPVPPPPPPPANANHPKPNKPAEKEMKSPEHRAKKSVERMTNELKLNAEQQQQVYTAEFNFFTQRDALQKRKESMTKEIFRDEVKSLKDKREIELRGILTPEQFDMHHRTMIEERQKHHDEPHQGE